MDLHKAQFKLKPETEIAISAALKAGKAVLKMYNQEFSFKLKKDDEPITEADTKSNELILKELAKLDYPILSEEGNTQQIINWSKKTWVIDPLDGTSDFINHTGEFSVMIGLIEGGIPILGVIYQPTNGFLYVAQKQQGAYKFSEGIWSRLRVNNVSDIHKCKAVVSRHHLKENEKSFLNILHVLKTTQLGSCGLKIAEVCKGCAELYFTTSNKVNKWDTCAAYCLIKESGGKITDMLGNELKYDTQKDNHEQGILVTNGLIHNKAIMAYKSFLK